MNVSVGFMDRRELSPLSRCPARGERLGPDLVDVVLAARPSPPNLGPGESLIEPAHPSKRDVGVPGSSGDTIPRKVRKVTATKSGESDLENAESTSKRGKPTIVPSVFHGAEPCIRAPIPWPRP
jgi:hypothetical protein